MKIIKTQGLTFILFIVILTILLSCCGVPDGNCSCSETCGNNTTFLVSRLDGLSLVIFMGLLGFVYTVIVFKLIEKEEPNFTTWFLIFSGYILMFAGLLICVQISNSPQSNSRSATYNERIVEEEYNRPPETSDTTKTWTAIEEVYDASGKVKKRIYKY